MWIRSKKSMFILILFYAIIDVINGQNNQAKCPDGWKLFGASCYLANMPTPLNYAQAESACTAKGSTLVSIHSQEENTFVKDLASNANPSAGAIYIGLRRTPAGAFYWTDGTQFDYGAATQPRGVFPWSPKGVWPAQPDGLPPPGDVTQMWLTGAGNQVAGSWDDINGGVPLAGAVCKQPAQTAPIQPDIPPKPDVPQKECPNGWKSFGTSCYLANVPKPQQGFNFGQAESVCTSKDSTLVSTHSQEENAFVKDLASKANPSVGAIYIGLRRTVTGAFYWTDGTLFDFGELTKPRGVFPWSPKGVYPAQPDVLPAPGDVTQMWLPGTPNQVVGSWDDINGGVPLAGAVCKRPKKSAQIPKSTGDNVVHDPTIIHIDQNYVVYSTHNGMEARQSKDKINWQRAGAAFPNGLDWIVPITGNKMEFWAPDVSFHNGKYWLYYCASKFGTKDSVIGVATSDTGMPGTWKDQGNVMSSNAGTPYNAIDPNLFTDSDGKWWLQFGSFFGGIFQVELDANTGKLAAGAQPRQIAFRPNIQNSPVEGPCLYKKGTFYYLFNSYDHCCSAPYTYSIRVGRSNTPNGPFVDANGVPMLQGGGTVVRGTSGTRLGPGGQSVYTDKDGSDLLVYHYYDAVDQNKPKLAVEKLAWSDSGWPYIQQ